MMKNCFQRVALVTGGSRGIGRSVCLALASHSAAVVVHYNSSAQSAFETVETIKQTGGTAIAVQTNLADPEAIEQLVVGTVNALGSVDILVNNAGEMTTASISDMTDEMWERSLSLNLTAAFRCTRACLASMKQGGWGRIINVSSQAAFTGSANHAHYAAAKAGLLGFTYSLAKELGDSGITANVVSPGRILTNMIQDDIPNRKDEWLKQVTMRRFGKPEEVANVIVFLASEGASYITGANIHVNGGLVMG